MGDTHGQRGLLGGRARKTVTQIVTTTPGSGRHSTTASGHRSRFDLRQPDLLGRPQTKLLCTACRRSPIETVATNTVLARLSGSEATAALPNATKPWQLVIDSDFAHSSVSEAKLSWEPEWEPTATVPGRHKATISFYIQLSNLVSNTGRHAATVRWCLLSSGSQVRILPGALTFLTWTPGRAQHGDIDRSRKRTRLSTAGRTSALNEPGEIMIFWASSAE